MQNWIWNQCRTNTILLAVESDKHSLHYTEVKCPVVFAAHNFVPILMFLGLLLSCMSFFLSTEQVIVLGKKNVFLLHHTMQNAPNTVSWSTSLFTFKCAWLFIRGKGFMGVFFIKTSSPGTLHSSDLCRFQLWKNYGIILYMHATYKLVRGIKKNLSSAGTL